jgi:hypothetical protein
MAATDENVDVRRDEWREAKRSEFSREVRQMDGQ